MKSVKWHAIGIVVLLAFLFTGCPPVPKHSVTFNSDGGTAVTEQTVVDGLTATKPDNPEKEGYEFLGWYLNDQAYDFTKPVTSDLTLKAKWKQIEIEKPAPEDPVEEYTVIFDSNGGSEVESVKVKAGEKVKEPESPTKDDFEFDGWFLSNKKYDFSKPVTKDITLKAKWTEAESEPEEFTVSFDTDGGSSIKSVKVADGNKVKKPDDPVKKGVKFVEWTLNDIPFDFNKRISRNITLKATYRDYLDFTVTFDPSNTESSIKKIIKEDSIITTSDIPVNPSKDGFIFLGWGLESGENEELEPFDYKTPITENITLKAIWVEEGSVETFTVTFDSNGASYMNPVNVLANSKVLNPAIPVKEGFVFVEWQLNGNKYDFETLVTSDITLVAKWVIEEVPTYKVTFDSNGGSAVNYVYVDENSTVSMPRAPTKNGYIFVGWTLNGVAYNFASPVTSDITLVANWQLEVNVNYTVTFDSNGGSTVQPVTVAKGSTVSAPSRAPTKAGYVFAGWTLNGAAYDFTTPVTADITLTATWTALPPSSFTVTVTLADEQPVDYGDDVTVTWDTTTNPGYLLLTASEGFDSYYWYLNSSTSNFTSRRTTNINISTWLPGQYSITVKAFKENIPYEKTYIVTISDNANSAE